MAYYHQYRYLSLRLFLMQLFILLLLPWGSISKRIGEKAASLETERRLVTEFNLIGKTTSLPQIHVVGGTGNPPLDALPLKLCQGDCDGDDQCDVGLICFQRDAFEEVAGCEGGALDPSASDYCIKDPNASDEISVMPTTMPRISMIPTQLPTKLPSSAPTEAPTTSFAPSDSPSMSSSPSISNAPSTSAAPTGVPSAVPSLMPSENPTSSSPPSDSGAPTMSVAPIAFPTSEPSPMPTPLPFGTVEYIGNDDTFYARYPLGICLGDCDSDEDCSEGLICYERDAYESVPYCFGGEEYSGTADFCTWDGISDPPEPPMSPPKRFFRLKIYWQEGYTWQNETFEREWCMSYDYDGYPGTGKCYVNNLELVPCSQDHVYVAKCLVGDDRQWFTFIDLGKSEKGNEILIQTADGRCFERSEGLVWLETCNGENSLQRWFAPDGSFDAPRFEISQQGYDTYCMSNAHHPKSGEVIQFHPCDLQEQHQTAYWNKF